MVCVTMNGFSFMITELLESLQNQTKSHRYSKVSISFSSNVTLKICWLKITCEYVLIKDPILNEYINTIYLYLSVQVEVQFDVSFYLVAGAGGMSVVAAACNLLRRPQPLEPSLYHR